MDVTMTDEARLRMARQDEWKREEKALLARVNALEKMCVGFRVGRVSETTHKALAKSEKDLLALGFTRPGADWVTPGGGL